MDRIKIIYKSLYNKYGKKTKQQYQNLIITNLILSKNCRAVALLKESMIYDFIDEFLKRYYKKKDSKIQIPKLVNYYKNYLRFFCKPTFRNYSLNNIIQHNGEKLAEIYYNNNYGKNSKNNNNNNNKKDNKKKVPNQFKIIFSDTVKNSINSISSSILNDNSSNKTIQLNQSSFRLLYKNNYGDDFENESLINLINDINGKPNFAISNQRNNKKIINNKIKNLIRYNSPEKDINIKNKDIKIFHSQGNEKRNKNYFNKEHIQLIVEEKNKLVIDTLHKEKDIKNKFNIINKNFSSDKNKFQNNGKLKLKLKSNPTHFKNILSTQLSPKIILTEVNNIHKRNQGRSSDLSNNNFYQTHYSRTTDNYNYNFNNNNNNIYLNNNNFNSYNKKNNFEPYKTGIINLKNRNINKLNKPSSRNLNSSKKSNNFISSFNNFEYQQQLLNNGKNLKIKGSFNSSSRNTISNHAFSHTQTFSPQSNRYIRNFKNDKSVNKVYLKVSRYGKI